MLLRKVLLTLSLASVVLALSAFALAQKDPTPQKDPTQVPTEVGKPVDPLDTSEIDAVTFWDKADEVYVPLKEFSEMIQWELAYDESTKVTTLEGKPLPNAKMRSLWDGTTLIALSAVLELGVTVDQLDDKSYGVKVENRSYQVNIPEKFVEISISRQTLRAWQGQRLVIKTHISSGMPGHATPQGHFRTGPVKQDMHHSSLYENAPMPWSTEVVGDVFTHGSNSVPGHPASHGCIRMPMTGKNAARYYYKWVDLGVRVNLVADWTEESRELIALEDEGATELASKGKITPPTGIGHAPRKKSATSHAAIVRRSGPKRPVQLAKPDPSKFVGPAARKTNQ